jgi:hypothetical protein
MALSGVGIVFGNVQDPSLQNLTEAATSLGATVYQPEQAAQANFLVASNVLKTVDGRDPYLVRAGRDGALRL